MTHYYCSTYSKDYIYKGLVLYNSLQKYDKDFHFFIICAQDEVKYLLEKIELSNATLISMKDIENDDWELANIKSTRNDKEYIWTSKASILLYLLNHFSELDHIIWLDGDTAFLSDPQPIFDEWGNYSVFLTEEQYKGKYEWLSKIYGVYNTGFMGFKRDQNALRCLQWFREKLIEWCFDKPEKGRWSDQMYVNDWVTRFDNVGVAGNLGINANLYISSQNTVTKEDDNLYINGDKLILFHYYGFKYFNGNEFDLCAHGHFPTNQIIQWIFVPYIQACNEVMDIISNIDKDFYYKQTPNGRIIKNYFNLASNIDGYEDKYNFCTIISEKDLSEGLEFYNSLTKHAEKTCLWICCLDDITYNTLANMELENVILIDIKNIEEQELLNVKNTRNASEYRWTLKAPLIYYILKNNYNIHYMIYADLDARFDSNVTNAFSKWKENPVFIWKNEIDQDTQQEYGINLTSLIGFKREKDAFNFLRMWRDKCIKGCYD
ncbi:glycosyltransferase [Neobacillus niacini]|uniref:glycosyltransferase n=1 Tax=Neobacillus niacini TaxID=86668 RepID=UPI002FFF4425